MTRARVRGALRQLLSGLGVGVVLMLSSCATYSEQTEPMRQLVRDHKYKAALKSLDAVGMQEQSKDRLLYRLEKASILDKMGDSRQSRKLLLEADKIVDELYTESISKGVASLVFNDSATDYAGEDYEKIGIHILLALSFLEDESYSSAQVSARKITHKLREINSKYDKKGRNKYSDDAFAHYLSGIIFEAQGDFDDALIDYKKALSVFAGGYRKFYHGKIPGSLVRATYELAVRRSRRSLAKGLKKKYPKLKLGEARNEKLGELIVIHSMGNIATKRNQEFIYPIGRRVVRFSFPVISPRRYDSIRYRDTGVRIHGRGFVPGENVQDLNIIARQTLSDKKTRLILKGLARLVAKKQLSDTAKRQFGPVAGLVVDIYGAISETGDTRAWTLLPEQYYVTRVKLKPGTYDVDIRAKGIMKSKRKIEIRNNRILILRDK